MKAWLDSFPSILAFLVLLCASGCPGPGAAGKTSPHKTELAEARQKGNSDAKESIAQGKLVLREYPPLPAPGWHGEYVRLLREKCQTDYQVVNSAVYSEALQEEVRGWNEAMEAEIRRRFGANVMQILRQEAEDIWKDRAKVVNP